MIKTSNLFFQCMMSQIYVLEYTINIHHVIVSCFSSREQECSLESVQLCVFLSLVLQRVYFVRQGTSATLMIKTHTAAQTCMHHYFMQCFCSGQTLPL